MIGVACSSVRRARTYLIGALCVAALAAPRADTALSEAKTLYAAASYEAALQALAAVDDDTAAVEALEYRVLCLLALGRTSDAQRVTDQLVTASPMLIPSADAFPPRFVKLVTETRRRLLPDMARRVFASGREQFHAAAGTDAVKPFEQVLALTADPAVADVPDAKDLRTLAMGYLDLLRARPQSPTQPRGQPTATQARKPALVVPAVPIRQTLPAWVGRGSTIVGSDLNGQVKLVIGADGRVKSATIVKPTHPSYDVLVLQSARDWTYQPATLNGQPVESERMLDIHVNGR